MKNFFNVRLFLGFNNPLFAGNFSGKEIMIHSFFNKQLDEPIILQITEDVCPEGAVDHRQYIGQMRDHFCLDAFQISGKHSQWIAGLYRAMVLTHHNVDVPIVYVGSFRGGRRQRVSWTKDSIPRVTQVTLGMQRLINAMRFEQFQAWMDKMN